MPIKRLVNNKETLVKPGVTDVVVVVGVVVVGVVVVV